MLTGKIIQETIEEIHGITGAPIALYDAFGSILYSVGDIKNQPGTAEAADFAAGWREGSDSAAMAKVAGDEGTEYVVSVGDGTSVGKMIADLTALQLSGLKNSGGEDTDRSTFFKNLLLDNLPGADLYGSAKRFRLEEKANRVVILIDFPSGDASFAAGRIGKTIAENDVLTAIDDRTLALVKQLEEQEGCEETEKTAKEAARAAGAGVRVFYGTITKELKDLPRSYKEAVMARDISRIFLSEKEVTAYHSLGISRLVYRLPMSLCRMFLKEVFGNRQADFSDEETITTVNRFFENNLNVSETSRQLYIHRNTLVYRLDKIYRLTGLDLRVFEDAMTFKIALMIIQYMKYVENNEK